jgi:hypothetical protein
MDKLYRPAPLLLRLSSLNLRANSAIASQARLVITVCCSYQRMLWHVAHG